MKQYLDLVSHIKTHGKQRDDRTGEGTISVFGYQMRFDLLEGFPLVTTKKTNLRAIVHELLWFLSGSVSRDDLATRNSQLLPHEFGNRYSVAHLALSSGGYERWEALGLVKQNLIVVATQGLCKVLGLTPRVWFEQPWSVSDVTPDNWEEFLKSMVPPNNIDYGFHKIHEREKLMEIKASVHTFCEGVGCPLPAPGKTTIWDEWVSDETGTIGPMYGQQWRSWPTEGGFSIDQIRQAVRELKTNPMSRRIIVNAWNPEFLPDSRISPKENVDAGNMALAPCHSFFQFYVEPATLEERIKWATQQKCYEFNSKIWEHMELNVYQATSDYIGAMEAAKLYALDALKIPTSKLSCQLYQRSADCFLGVPFNIASYSLLTMMMAQSVDMIAGDFIWTGGDVHLYKNHAKQVALMLSHKPHPLPKVILNPLVKDIDDFVSDDIVLVDYVHGPHIAAPVAV